MSIRHLVAKLDLDLIARVKAGTAGRRAEPKPMKRQKPPRARETYRGYRRNQLKRRGPG